MKQSPSVVAAVVRVALTLLVLSLSIVSCGGGGGGGGSTPTGPTPPASQLYTLSGTVTEGPATSGFEGYFRDDTGGNEVGGFGRGSEAVLGEQSREREQPDEILIDANPNIADPLHAAGVGDTVAGVVVQIIDGPHMGKSATTGNDGSYQIVGVSGGMTLTAEKSGYKTQTKSVTVSADTTLNFALAIDILTYTLSGYVREDGVASSSTAGEPVPGVVVRVTDGPYIDKSSTTGSDGRYEIVGVVGGMTLSAAKTGYTTLFKSVTVTSDTPLDFDVGRETRNISGRITDIVTGSAAVNLTVEIEGVGTTTTNADGQYGFDTNITGILPMTLSGAGYIRRDTYIDAGGALTVNATVIADGGDYSATGFSLAFHDEVFRRNGERGTKRWTSQPTYQIWMRELSCTETEATDDDRWRCKKATVLDESVSGSWFYNTALSALAGDVSTLTDGKFSGPYSTYTPQVGTEIDLRSSASLTRGVINVVQVHYPDAHTDSDYVGVSYVRMWYYTDYNDYSRGWLIIDDLEDRESTMTHEIAHTLGFGHPNGYDFSQYPGGSIMGGNRITSRDVLQGGIMYARPVWSHTPDIDPTWFKVNAAMSQGRGSRGQLTMEIHCCR